MLQPRALPGNRPLEGWPGNDAPWRRLADVPEPQHLPFSLASCSNVSSGLRHHSFRGPDFMLRHHGVVRAMLLALLVAVSSLAAIAAEPRAARSGHLGYPAPDAAVFTTEMTVLASMPGNYIMAAGWNTGYFGIQELANVKKVVIFSVWDPTKDDDPRAVKDEDLSLIHI